MGFFFYTAASARAQQSYKSFLLEELYLKHHWYLGHVKASLRIAYKHLNARVQKLVGPWWAPICSYPRLRCMHSTSLLKKNGYWLDPSGSKYQRFIVSYIVVCMHVC